MFQLKSRLQPSPELMAAMADSQSSQPVNQPQPSPSQDQSQPQPQQPSASDQGDFSAHGLEGGHIDALIGSEPAQAAPVANLKLGKNEFHKMFCGGFVMASHLSGLQSLHVDEADGKARAASEALYETIEEIPALHFLLQPGGQKMQRVIAIAAFGIPLQAAVRAEVQAKRGAGRAAATPSASRAFPIVNTGG